MTKMLLAGVVGLTGLWFTLVESGNPRTISRPVDPPQDTNWGLYLPEKIDWKPGPSSLLPGTKMAILEGDPSKEGVFTMRLRMPDGFIVAPHWHTQIEHVTVIAGVLNFGMGDKFDKSSTRPMKAGSFGFWPPGMKHFGWTTGETVLQLHGKGPWTVTYVNPSDDPRNRK